MSMFRAIVGRYKSKEATSSSRMGSLCIALFPYRAKLAHRLRLPRRRGSSFMATLMVLCLVGGARKVGGDCRTINNCRHNSVVRIRTPSIPARILTAVASAACMRLTGPPAVPPAAARLGAAPGCAFASARVGVVPTGRFSGTIAGDAETTSLPAASLKKATRSSMALAWCSSVLAVAAFSSTSAEFCCVTSSIWVRALLTCSMPSACSALALAMSETIEATVLIDSRIH